MRNFSARGVALASDRNRCYRLNSRLTRGEYLSTERELNRALRPRLCGVLRFRRLWLFLIPSLATLLAYTAQAQLVPYPVDTWPQDAAVATGAGNLGLGTPLHPGIAMVGDGQGGAILVWDDQDHPALVSQRLSASGASLWGSGMRVTRDPSLQKSPLATPDGVGGAIVAWLDGRYAIPGTPNTNTLFVQRLSSAGSILWNSDGVLITAEYGNPQYYSIVSDGAGGAILVWRGETGQDNCCQIIAQRVLSDGTVAWAAGGEPLTPIGDTFTAVKAASDGAGGVLVAYADITSTSRPVPLEVQRIGPDGTMVWNPGAVTVGAMNSPYNHDFDLVSDGSNGAIVAWDALVAGAPVIAAQRVDAQGNLLWNSAGITVSSATGNRVVSDLAADGAGGAVVIWDDSRNDPSLNGQDCYNLGTECDIYAQRLAPDGTPAWTPNGAPVVVAPNAQFRGQLVPSNDGSFLATWSDCRDAPDVNSCLDNMKIYMQVLTSNGAPYGSANGVPVSIAPWNQGTTFELEGGWPGFARISDALGGAVFAWPDGRNNLCDFSISGSACQVYAQRVGVPGSAGMPSTTPTATATATPTSTPTPVAAAISVKPARINFGKVDFLGNSVPAGKPKYVTIENARTNTQNAAIVIEQININAVLGTPRSGLHYLYSVPPGQCIGTLPAGAKCELEVSYTPYGIRDQPGAMEEDGGSLSLVTNGSSQPLVALSGTAILRDIHYTPRSLKFGHQQFLTSSGPLSVTVTNPNPVAVGLGSVGTQGGGGSFAAFSLSFAQSTCYSRTDANWTVPANGSCTLAVTYTPSKIGHQVGRLFVESFTGPIFETARLSGTGTQPR